jgi:predicted DNA-binding transcriptional regulator AlpA
MSDTATTPRWLYGAAAIAEYLGVKRSVVYHLAETSDLPIKKRGAIITAVPSALDRWIQGQDATAA